jgi:hypothetical protein
MKLTDESTHVPTSVLKKIPVMRKDFKKIISFPLGACFSILLLLHNLKIYDTGRITVM